ncbi:MAG: hypothetical protein ACKOXR_04705 [Bacteroidota bacterium]
MSYPGNTKNSPSIASNAIFWLLGIMAVLGLLNLDRLPIAWNDEVQNLDPALVWHNTGIFCSPLWPNPGAETKFLSYPPLIEAWHCLWLFFGKSIWITRLPFLVAHLLTAFLLYRCLLSLLKNQEKSIFWAFILTALFLFDKSTGEIARSLRVETPILLLLACLMPLLSQFFKEPSPLNAGLIGAILSGLALAHLYTWPLVATVLFLCFLASPKKKRLHTTLPLLILFALPCFLFWITVQPDLHQLKTQLFMQAADHSSHSLTNNLYAFFLGRFYPYSLEQPYTPFLHLLYFVGAIQLLYFYRNSFQTTQTALVKAWIPLLYLSLSLPMMLAIAPQHRYYPVQHFLGILTLADAIVCLGFPWKTRKISSWLREQTWTQNQTIRRTATLCFVFVLIFPYAIRHSAALFQRKQRNPDTAIEFLNKNLNNVPAGDILGEPIANYWLAQSPNPKNWRFGFEFYPQHFAFNPSIPRYFLSRVTPNQLPFLTPLDSLKIPPSPWQQKLKMDRGGHTYHGLFLYRIPNQKAWNALIRPEVLKATSGH